MRRLSMMTLILLALGLSGCRSLAGPEIKNTPRTTPTSKTEVTSTKGTNIYKKNPTPPATTTAPR